MPGRHLQPGLSLCVDNLIEINDRRIKPLFSTIELNSFVFCE